MSYISRHMEIAADSDYFVRLGLSNAEIDISVRTLSGAKRMEVAYVIARDEGLDEHDTAREVDKVVKAVQEKADLPKERGSNFSRKLLANGINALNVKISDRTADATTSLNSTEKEVLLMVAAGKTNHEIQTEKSFSSTTLRGHFRKAESKLAALSPEHAALLYVAGRIAKGDFFEQFSGLSVEPFEPIQQ